MQNSEKEAEKPPFGLNSRSETPYIRAQTKGSQLPISTLTL